MFNIGGAFIKSIKAEDSILIALGATRPAGQTTYKGARLFTTSWPDDDDHEPAIPYCIVVSGKMQRINNSKDEGYEYSDSVRIVVTAKDEPALDSLCEDIYDAIEDHLEDNMGATYYLTETPDFESSDKGYDPEKACYFRELFYTCYTAKQ